MFENYKTKQRYKPFLFLIDFIGYCLFFWTKLQKLPTKINRILVIRLDHLGDMIMATPVFKTLKLNFPKAEIHVLCRSLTRSIIENNVNVDQIIELNPPWFTRKDSDGWISILSKIKALKGKYDLVIELHTDPRNILLAYLIGGYRIGYSVRGLGFLLNATGRYIANIHTVDKNLELLKLLGIRNVQHKLEICIDKSKLKTVKALLNKNKIKQYIIIHPVTGRPNKNWSITGWANLCAKIKDKIIFTGSKEDANSINKIITASRRTPIYNFAGKTNLHELAYLIKNSKLVITTDTVTVHMAAALNKEQIILYGPTQPEIWGPYRLKKARVISHKCKCVELPKCKFTLNEGLCMRSIKCEEVLKQIEDVGRV